ncbi:MAG: PepSY-associated TM helix domain-containing protein [Pseudomonadota bacterium]
MKLLSITDEFRASMNWLHTWAGVAVSCFLFMIFWMGSLAVFDREIDQWMKPQTRVVSSEQPFAFNPIVESLLKGEAKGTSRLFISVPKEREPNIEAGYLDTNGEFQRVLLHPQTGQVIEATDSYAGTGFFYPFHYSLHIRYENIGYWIVGFSAMSMLVLMVSGIFIHRKIVQDFFTFRPKKAARRSTLDLHNLSSLVALPLHVLFPLTGLMIFFSIYLPWSSEVVFDGDTLAKRAEVFGQAQIEPSGSPFAGEVDVDRLVADVEERWAQREPGANSKADFVDLRLANDANAYLIVREVFPSRAVSMNKNITTVSAISGKVKADVAAGAAKSTYAWLAGAHFIQFDSWALRWLYFAGGLLGSTMIATGLMFWIQARIRKGAIEPRSVRVVRGLAIGSITGIILASGVYLVANRLIPVRLDAIGMARADFEVLFFYLVWIATFIHAALLGKSAWRDQCLVIAFVAIAAAVLNWITTPDHPIAAISKGLTQVWSMDLVLLAGAAAALFATARLRKTRDLEAQQHVQRDSIQSEAMPAE